MVGRLAILFVAVAGSIGAAQAADLGGAWSGGGEVYCGSDMITIYDSQPGVVARRWKTHCKNCDHRRVSAPFVFQPYPPFMEPWRR